MRLHRALRRTIRVLGALILGGASAWGDSPFVLNRLDSRSLPVLAEGNTARTVWVMKTASNGDIYAATGDTQATCSAPGTPVICTFRSMLVRMDSNFNVLGSIVLPFEADVGTPWSMDFDSNGNVIVGLHYAFQRYSPNLVIVSTVIAGTANVARLAGLDAHSTNGDVYTSGGGNTGREIARWSAAGVLLASNTLTGVAFELSLDETNSEVVFGGDAGVGISRMNSNLVLISSVASSGVVRRVGHLPDGTIIAAGVSGSELFVEKYSRNLELIKRTAAPMISRNDVFQPGMAVSPDGVFLIIDKQDPQAGPNLYRPIVFSYDTNLNFRSQLQLDLGRGYSLAYDQIRSRLYAGGIVRSDNGNTTSVVYRVGAQAASNASDAYAYPSPFSPSIASHISFAKLPAEAKVRIYTAGRHFVRELHAGPNGELQWDARDSGGARVPPGTYFFTVSSESGGGSFRVLILP